MSAAIPTSSLVYNGPFHTVLVDTTADCVVTCPVDNLLVQHLGFTQTNSTAAWVACSSGDIVIITDPNCTRYVATSQQSFANGDNAANTGHKAVVVPNSNFQFRGFDLLTTEANLHVSRQFTLRCVGTVPVYCQLGRGSFSDSGI